MKKLFLQKLPILILLFLSGCVINSQPFEIRESVEFEKTNPDNYQYINLSLWCGTNASPYDNKMVVYLFNDASTAHVKFATNFTGYNLSYYKMENDTLHYEGSTSIGYRTLTMKIDYDFMPDFEHVNVAIYDNTSYSGEPMCSEFLYRHK